MAINTQERRNSALIDSQGVVFPDGGIHPFDKYTLLGQYSWLITNDDTDSISVNFYADRARSVSVYSNRSRTINSYAERARTITLER